MIASTTKSPQICTIGINEHKTFKTHGVCRFIQFVFFPTPMKKYLTHLLCLFFVQSICAQYAYDVSFDTMSINGLPGLHSFASAQYDGKWLLIGGRLDGLHPKFGGFEATNANKNIYVVQPENGQVWTKNTSELSDTLREQLQSSNMEYAQFGNWMCFAGGYGQSSIAQTHITYPYLTLINIPDLIEAVITNDSLLPHIQQIPDTFFAVAGGQLQYIADTFYLVGGHKFEGIYSANSGGNLLQTYTDGIRKFTLQQPDSTNWTVSSKNIVTDQLSFHRRDFNMTPTIFAQNKPGLLAFSGVFQPISALLPFFNIVEIDTAGHHAVEGFNQLLANYHCAKFPMYESEADQMHTLFFGGMSKYSLNDNDSLVSDNRIPFVRTASRVTRRPDGQYEEHAFDAKLPYFTGTSADFLWANNLPMLPNTILDADALPEGQQLIGYIVGGIVTPETQTNPFISNVAGITSANPQLIRVYLHKNVLSETLAPISQRYDLQLDANPNPANTQWQIGIELTEQNQVVWILQNTAGQIMRAENMGKWSIGKQTFTITTDGLPDGQYFLTAIVGGLKMKTIILHCQH